MISCNKSSTGPNDTIPADILTEISVEVLNWEQECTEGQVYSWDNIQVIYKVKNTGNIFVKNYTMIWTFYWCDTLDIGCSSFKIINCYEALEIEEEKTDTINSGALNWENPAIKINCSIRDINS